MSGCLKKYSGILLALLVSLVSLIGLSLIFSADEFFKSFAFINKAEKLWLIVSLFFGTLAYISRAIRWGYLLHAMGYSVAFNHRLSAVALAYFMNFFIPRSGEFLRCTFLYKTDEVPVDHSLGTVISERSVDLIMLFFGLLLAIAIRGDLFYELFHKVLLYPSRLNYFILFFLSLLIIGIIVFIAREKIKKTLFYKKISIVLKGLCHGISSLREMKNKKAFIFHTLIIWGSYYLMTYLICFSSAQTSSVSPFEGLFILILGAFGMLVPAFGNIGSYHSAMIWAFLSLGFTKNIGLSFGTLVHVLHSGLSIAGGFLVLSFLLFIKIRSYFAKNG